MDQAAPIVSEWVCEKSPDWQKCFRITGTDKEYRIIIPADSQNLMPVFIPTDIDTSKLPPNEFLFVGETLLIGWPSWHPIFWKKYIYSFRYPFKDTAVKK